MGDGVKGSLPHVPTLLPSRWEVGTGIASATTYHPITP